MKKRVKIAIGFIIVVLVACIAGFINAWIMTGGLTLSDLTEDQKLNSEKLWVEHILLTETKEGKKYWEIYGKNGQYVDKKDRIIMNKIIGNFYDDDGTVILSFSGDKGEYETKTKRMILTKNAKIATKDYTQMNADKMTWEGNDGIIHAEGHIKAVRADELLITCDRSVFSTDFGYFRVYGHTTTKLYEKGGK